MALLNFDAHRVNPAQPSDLIPRGRYPAVIVDSAIKPTKNRQGDYLQFAFAVQGPAPYAGRKLFARLHLNSPNPTVVEIAQQELSALCRAVGVMDPKDSRELHGVPLMIEVGIHFNRETGEPVNRIRGYLPLPDLQPELRQCA